MKERVGVDCRASDGCESVAACPLDCAVMDDGDADAGDVELGHALLKSGAGGRRSLDEDCGGEAGFNTLDALLRAGRRRR